MLVLWSPESCKISPRAVSTVTLPLHLKVFFSAFDIRRTSKSDARPKCIRRGEEGGVKKCVIRKKKQAKDMKELNEISQPTLYCGDTFPSISLLNANVNFTVVFARLRHRERVCVESVESWEISR